MLEKDLKLLSMKQSIKHFNVCSVDFPTMYRIQYKNPKEWVFVFEESLLKVKANNCVYRYGGTLKK